MPLSEEEIAAHKAELGALHEVSELTIGDKNKQAVMDQLNTLLGVSKVNLPSNKSGQQAGEEHKVSEAALDDYLRAVMQQFGPSDPITEEVRRRINIARAVK